MRWDKFKAWVLFVVMLLVSLALLFPAVATGRFKAGDRVLVSGVRGYVVEYVRFEYRVRYKDSTGIIQDVWCREGELKLCGDVETAEEQEFDK